MSGRVRTAQAPSTFEVRQHEARVHELLGAVYRQNGNSYEPVENATPLSALIDAEERMEAEERYVRVETMRALLTFLFVDPHPAQVVRRAYLLAKAYSPELLLNMSFDEIAFMLGETAAAQSERMKRILNTKIAQGGARTTQIRLQKRYGTLATYAEVQKGNHNRAKGAKKKAAAAA